MLEDNFSCLGWAFGSYFRLDRLAAEFRSVQTLAWIAALAAFLFLYATWRNARLQKRELRSNTLERLGCNRLVDSRILQEGAEITVHAVGNQGGANLDARIGTVRRGLMEIWLDGQDADFEIAIGAPIELWQPSPSGGLQIQAIVVDKRVEEHGVTLMVDRPNWLANFQRRRFRRFRVLVPAVVSVAQSSDSTSPVRRALINDLSGGGFRMTATEPIPPGSTVSVALAGPEATESSYTAKVLLCDQRQQYGDGAYDLQCEFVNLSDNARKAIIDFCISVKLAGSSRLKGTVARSGS